MSEPEVDPHIGRLVAGRYRIIKPLGEGGMGQVYLAEHEAIEKKVALKVLRPEYSRKEDIVTRFQQEAISASRIKHPNVLDVFDFGQLDSGEAFLAMEFLEGHDLADEIAKFKTIPPVRGIHITLQICRALGAAHARGVVHRDMKPDNVFLQRAGDEEVVKIVDFGIAQLRSTEEEAAKSTEPARRRLTKTGMIFGTPEYMAPEQAGGRHADLRVDIYAVGVILFEMFTGSVPFTGDSFMAVLTSIITQLPPTMRSIRPDLALSPELEAAIMRALSKEPAARYANMSEFAAALIHTPEGAQFARPSHGSMAESRVSSYPQAGAATAAQFGAGSSVIPGPPGVPPVAGGPETAAFGTPGMATSGKTTPLAGQSSSIVPPQPKPPSGGLVVGSLGFVVVLLGIGGYVMFGRKPAADPATTAPTIAQEPHAPLPTAPVVTPTPTAVPAAAVVEPAAAPSRELRLHVVTEPPDAVVSKGGFQVCASTPCDVVVIRNEGVELAAQKGTQHGVVKILPQEEQTVTITLSAPVSKPKPTTTSGPKMCEVEVEGLKDHSPVREVTDATAVQSRSENSARKYTFRGNVASTRHGWLRLTPAYSVHLVREILGSVDRTCGGVLDPFCGTGTTLLACAETGLDCTTVDVNPFLVWLASAKVADYDSKTLRVAAGLVERMAAAARARSGARFVPDIHRIERWWGAAALGGLGRAAATLRAEAAEVGPRASDLGSLALCRALIDVASVSFGHQSMSFRRPDGAARHGPVAVARALDAAFATLADAAQTGLKRSKRRVVLGDSRSLDPSHAGRYGAVVTSPPYSNRMSYIREVRPYMYWLGYLTDRRGAGELDWRAIGGTWGSATSRLATWKADADTPIPFDGFERIVQRISEREPLLGNYVRRYFEDMARHAESLFRVVAPGGRVHYVVGNSKFYDVLVPAEEIFAALFEGVGFRRTRITVLRKRTSKRELFEYLVEATKPD